MGQVVVMAVPLNNDQREFGLECSDCGPLRIIAHESVETACREHLIEHDATDIHEVEEP